MFLLCKDCGSTINWENIVLGHLDRDVYRCQNKKCQRSIYHYIEPKNPLPEWIYPSIAKAN